MKTNAEKTLASYVDALYPIIYINHFDFHVIDDTLHHIANDRKIVEFNHGIGFVNFFTKSAEKRCDLEEFLDDVKDDGYDNPTFIVLKDVHGQLEEPNVISLLKYIASRNLYRDEYNATIFIVASRLSIPKELEEIVTVFDVPLPTDKEIQRQIDEFTSTLEIDVEADTISELCLSLKGLNEFQIQQILNLAFQDGGTLDTDDKQLILRQKEQLLRKSGLLEMVNFSESIEDIGGLENLKGWLYRKERIFNQLDKAIKFGVDVPKGILIVGMPGCGKSLAAKATAKLFQIPLVRLDVGRLLGKYVGESEENMREALKLAEAISPCVLWVDEIEKAFSGVGSSGGGSDVTTRLFGQFLTWMQEKENTVFIVATANNISNLPPEFLRKGRFDELFYVDLPNYEERRKIIEIHLKKRGKYNSSIDIRSIASETEGYNGADLEAIVKDAVETCFIESIQDKQHDCELTTNDLKVAKESIKSITDTLEKQIKKIRDTVKDMDLKSASSSEGEDVKESALYQVPASSRPLERTDITLLSILGHKWWREGSALQDESKSTEDKSSQQDNNTSNTANSFSFKVENAFATSNGKIRAKGKLLEGTIHVGDWCSLKGSNKKAEVEEIRDGSIICQQVSMNKNVELLLDGPYISPALVDKTLFGGRPTDSANNTVQSSQINDKKVSFAFEVILASPMGPDLIRARVKVTKGTIHLFDRCSVIGDSRVAFVDQIGTGKMRRQEISATETDDIILKSSYLSSNLKGKIMCGFCK